MTAEGALAVGSGRVLVIGAGIGGLCAALDLAARGVEVTVLERANAVGGKLREVEVEGRPIDSGPTVFTLRSVFDALFTDAGTALDQHLTLRPADILARHAWDMGPRLDLFADMERSVDAVGDFAGAAEAARFRAFSKTARTIWRTLEHRFVRSANPSLAGLIAGASPGALWRIQPFVSLWRALGDHFRHPRLRQLFGRYATYCGGSPFETPATLMLVAHVEREGVWLVEGGMQRIPEAIANVAAARGARFRCGVEVETIRLAQGAVAGVTLAGGECIDADAVVANADAAALADGRFGPDVRGAAAPLPHTARSFSALTWSLVAETDGFPVSRHNVFFSADYPAEFADLRARRLPARPTVYVCAQDREGGESHANLGPERLLLIVNAPADGDRRSLERAEIVRCEEATFDRLRACGLTIRRRPQATTVTTPTDFDRMFPATGGALYGAAPHGWAASFRRPGARSRIPGLYLAGGSIHPGPGLPMAALSGRHAAASILADRDSIVRSRRAGMRGGTSMHSATMDSTASR